MFDPATDFEQIADGLQTVTLLTTEGASSTITGALRRSTRTAEPVPSGGHAAAHDCVWHLPVSQVPDRPELGSRVKDAAGDEWTILEVQTEVLAARWQCRTRNLSLAHDLRDRIYLERPQYQCGKHGSAVVSWSGWGDQIPARVQPMARVPELVDGAGQENATFMIYVAAWEANSAQVRIQDAGGRQFEVLRIQRAEQLGELVQIQARQIA